METAGNNYLHENNYVETINEVQCWNVILCIKHTMWSKSNGYIFKNIPVWEIYPKKTSMMWPSQNFLLYNGTII